MKKIYEPITDTNKNTSEKLTKTVTETSIKNNKILGNLNNKLSEMMSDRGILASFLLSPLSKVINPENSTQFKFVKDFNSNRVNDMLIHIKIADTLYNFLLTFRDLGKEFELQGDLVKMITNKNYNIDLAKLSDKKITYDLAMEMQYEVRAPGSDSIRDRNVLKLLKCPAIRASGISTIFLPENPNELCDRLKLLLQEKQAGKKSNMINEEISALVDKPLQYKCISKKQH